MMSIEEQLKALHHIMQRWKQGAKVWHRSDGKRGIVLEYILDNSGAVLIGVCFAHNSTTTRCYPVELSAVRISDGTDGDEWMDTDGHEEARS